MGPEGCVSDPLYSQEQLESASSDEALKGMLSHCIWLQNREYKTPPWSEEREDVHGFPHMVLDVRRNQLCCGFPPETDNERRFGRNRDIITHIATALCTPYPSLYTRFSFIISNKTWSIMGDRIPPSPALRDEESTFGDDENAYGGDDSNMGDFPLFPSEPSGSDYPYQADMERIMEDRDDDIQASALDELASTIYASLDLIVAGETIHLCGLRLIKIMEDNPDGALQVAYNQLYNKPFASAPVEWRRMYEDATLAKAALLLKKQASQMRDSQAQAEQTLPEQTATSESWFAEVVKVLDVGFITSGAPARKAAFYMIFEELEAHIPAHDEIDPALLFNTSIPHQLKARPENSITLVTKVPTQQAFQQHINQITTPLLIPGAITYWPASKKWHSPSYFLQKSLDGHRQVPIEIGESYTHASWKQKIVSFREFIQKYMIQCDGSMADPGAENEEERGYLAQYNLFDHVPDLRDDIDVPAFLPNAEPMINAWFGPAGTKTPLHTDPYLNVFCQVVGYKYVRLYPATETEMLYPCGVDGKGVDMGNTSRVDVGWVAPRGKISGAPRTKAVEKRWAEMKEEMNEKFPLLKGARYVEGWIGPGECLFVPRGWWHYVESLSASFSVSFWWD